ncbi:DNA-directed RNA polymerase I subunit RPA12 [Trichoplax sp. H2]|nr:DNA-directed RNA polymerase I subunit RPA12 [Trichoplax sp. H2]|eukprot:RDD43431.1 DNA-directed RNA polymerase I subunit RPA12 [Trichoplax sp. H2]
MSQAFICETGFCPRCGSIMPSPSSAQTINCIVCNNQISIDSYLGVETKSTITFNAIRSKGVQKIKDDTQHAKGPIIERKCEKCSNNSMTYYTQQTRSADEGQTVFYSCTKCG